MYRSTLYGFPGAIGAAKAHRDSAQGPLDAAYEDQRRFAEAAFEIALGSGGIHGGYPYQQAIDALSTHAKNSHIIEQLEEYRTMIINRRLDGVVDSISLSDNSDKINKNILDTIRFPKDEPHILVGTTEATRLRLEGKHIDDLIEALKIAKVQLIAKRLDSSPRPNHNKIIMPT